MQTPVGAGARGLAPRGPSKQGAAWLSLEPPSPEGIMAQQAAAQKINHVFNESARDESAAEPVIDLVHLSKQTLGDAALETELLRLFEEQALAFAVRLRAPAPLAPAPLAETARDIQQRIVLAHTLKGSSRAIGAFALADAAQAYEDALRANAPDADASPRRLLAALDSARAEISRLL
jgi:HPt (histidine-containing phosphotransfer) domain-containing protein